MNKELRILQANMWRGRESQHALHNDPALAGFHFILGQEPGCFLADGEVVLHGTNPHWMTFVPFGRRRGQNPVRSCMWVSRDVAATQVHVDSADITAVVAHVGGKKLVVVSVYIPDLKSMRTKDESWEALTSRLDMIKEIVQEEQLRDPYTEVVVAGDFNRHNPLWGGSSVGNEPRQDESEPIIDFMAELSLQSLLPAGTITYECVRGKSTIDLMLATTGLAEDLVKCSLWEHEYGSDHRAIATRFSMNVVREERQERLLLKNAPWDKIRAAVEQEKEEGFPDGDVDEMADRLTSWVDKALEARCPRARPSPYMKRWWNEDLTTLRKSYTYWRNRACAMRRQGRVDEELRCTAMQAKRLFHRTIRRHRKQHWEDFLDNSDNIWKAAKYLDTKATASFARVPPIKKAGTEDEFVTENQDIAGELLRAFFPPPPSCEPEGAPGGYSQLPWEPITKDEVKNAVFRASPDKAPGRDGLPARVWRELWPVLGDEITQLFARSLDTGKVPREWKIAKIIPLQKPKRGDYTIANNYRPISLLPTLGKALESLVAERIAYLVEEYGLLPKTHFGARKQRSTTHALSYLCEDVFKAWRGRKTLSLVSFDVKGAYNNVATGPEIRRLRQRQIPEVIVQWVQDFCTDRRACILVNNYTSDVQTLPQAGLPQGSALAPILFLFFNADLVQSAPKNGSSMAFVDDYSAWVIGPSAEENTRILQNEVVPRLEKWERTSGAVFDAEKTSFIHLTRYKGAVRESTTALRFKEKEILPTNEVKLLGVTLDKGLRFKAHLAHKAGKATKVALALRRLKGLRPKTVKQLAKSAVLPVADYASPVWYPIATHEMKQLLMQAQRITAQAVIRAFRTVAGAIAEVEAGLIPMEQRLRNQTIAFWVSLHKLGQSHPHWMLKRQRLCTKHRSPLMRTAEMCEDVRMDDVMEVKPYACPPWVARPEVVLCEGEEQARDIIDDYRPGQVNIFVDASVRNGRAGIGIYATPSGVSISRTVASSDQADAHLTELLAISEAANWPWNPSCIAIDEAGFQVPASHVRIFSDAQSALLSVQSWRASACQEVVDEIIRKLRMSNTTLYWVPSHSGIRGNERADWLAKTATRAECEEPPQREGRPWYFVKQALKKANITAGPLLAGRLDVGKFTRKIDAALHLGKAAALYQQLNSSEAAVLAQLRTGMTSLNTYLYKIRAAETAECECGLIESIPHFLFCCRKWAEQRQELRLQHGERFGDLSYALGGFSSRKEGGESIDGPIERWKPDIDVVRATIQFAMDTGRLQTVSQDTSSIEEDENERQRLQIPTPTL